MSETCPHCQSPGTGNYGDAGQTFACGSVGPHLRSPACRIIEELRRQLAAETERADRLDGIVERLRKAINAVVNGFYAARSGRLGGQQLTNAEYDEVMQAADYAIDTLVENAAAEAALTEKEPALPPCPRKCEVCAGSDHHWLDGFSNDDDGDAENPGDPVLVCKHCGVMRPWVDIAEGSDK